MNGAPTCTLVWYGWRREAPEDARARIIACDHTETPTGWISQAATAHRVEDVLG